MELQKSLDTEDIGGIALDPLLVVLDALLVIFHFGSLFHSLPICILEPTEGQLRCILECLSSLFDCSLHPAGVLGNVLTYRLRSKCPLSSGRVGQLAPFFFSRPIRAQYLALFTRAPRGQPTLVGHRVATFGSEGGFGTILFDRLNSPLVKFDANKST